jgi:HEAT repeat protein
MKAATKRPMDRADRAIAAVRRGVDELVGLLGDEDQAVVDEAALALDEVGPSCVGPLAAALPRGRSPRHRAAIIGALMTFAPQALVPVGRALERAALRDRDPYVRARAQAALRSLIAGQIPQGTAGAPVARPG